MRKPEDPKERNFIKGAMRRVFSRSDLRRQALEKVRIHHRDLNRPRVIKWGWCMDCGLIEPLYKMQVDHLEPLIEVNKSLEDYSWDAIVDRLWCSVDNLRPLCKSCHSDKTKKENKERRMFKKGKQNK